MKKNNKTFLASIFCLAGFGLLVGFGAGFIFDKVNVSGLVEFINAFFNNNILILLIGFNSICAVFSFYFYKKAKKEVEKGLVEDDYIESKYIDYSNTIKDAGFFILISLLMILYNTIKESSDPIRDTQVEIAIFVVFTLLYTCLSNLNYKLVRKIEPDRKTDIFDFFFERKFMAESDERDKLKNYKKGYLAYNRMLICQFVIMIILFCSALYENVSPVIALIVLIPCLVGIFTNGFAGENIWFLDNK